MVYYQVLVMFITILIYGYIFFRFLYLIKQNASYKAQIKSMEFSIEEYRHVIACYKEQFGAINWKKVKRNFGDNI